MKDKTFNVLTPNGGLIENIPGQRFLDWAETDLAEKLDGLKLYQTFALPAFDGVWHYQRTA